MGFNLLVRALVLLAIAFDGASAFPLFYRYAALRSASAGIVGDIRRPPGYTTTLFSDGFTGTAGSLPSTDRWTFDTGTKYAGGPASWGTGEKQTYTQSTTNIHITSSGTLLITPVKGADNTWTSARIESNAAWDVTAAVGKKLRIESRLRLGGDAAASQLGIWMAFWSLGAAYRGNYQNWPSVGEIDILESLNGDSTAYETVHCGTTTNGGPCRETTGISASSYMARNTWYTVAAVVDRTASASAADWTGESISWLVNEHVVATVKATDVNDQAAWKALAQTAKFVLLNVAVGGSFPDALAGVTTPTAATTGGAGSSLEVDYVAVFST